MENDDLIPKIIHYCWFGRNEKAGDVTALKKLFDEIAPSYKDRNGGYTSVLKTGVRKGDNAPTALITWVK